MRPGTEATHRYVRHADIKRRCSLATERDTLSHQLSLMRAELKVNHNAAKRGAGSARTSTTQTQYCRTHTRTHMIIRLPPADIHQLRKALATATENARALVRPNTYERLPEQ